MTEDRWQSCADPQAMLRHLLRCRASPRKLRLLSCACVRGAWRFLADESIRKVVEVSEQYAHGSRNARDVGAACMAAGRTAVKEKGDQALAARLALATAETVPQGVLETFRSVRRRESGIDLAFWDDQWRSYVGLLRDIFGDPFRRPAVDPAWLTGKNRVAARIALTIYRERRFAEVPVLADALEEAGCSDADILSHCRGPGPHVLGCWVLDLLLGKA